MTYREQLHHWIVVRHLPNMQRIVVGRFYRRSDADGHQQFLQQRFPSGSYAVMFDCDRVTL